MRVHFKDSMLCYLIPAVIGCFTALFLNIVLSLIFPELFTSYQAKPRVSFWLFYSVMIAPLFEELVFRAGLYRLIKKFTGNVVVSIALSSLFFAVYHLNFIQGIYAFGMGVVFCYFYYKTEKLDIPYFMHVTANAFSLLPLSFLFTSVFTRVLSLVIVFALFVIFSRKYEVFSDTKS